MENRISQVSTVVVGLLLLTSGCKGLLLGSSESMAEAQARVEQETQTAANATFPPRFSLAQLSKLSMSCTDLEDKSTGQKHASVTYWVDNIDHQRNNEYFDKLKTWWENNGWKTQNDTRPDGTFMNATKDDYTMNLQTTSTLERRVSIGANSPCVWPDGAPDSK